jgi:hypothetical protein
MDSSHEQFLDHQAEMAGDWITLEYGDLRIKELKDLLNVAAIPQLTILKEEEVLIENGRNDVFLNGARALELWID